MADELRLQYRNIGRIIVEFNKLDLQINDFIGWLINDDIGIGQIVTANIQSFSARLKLLFSLYKNQASGLKWFHNTQNPDVFQIRKDLVDKMHELKQKADLVKTTRNKIVHAYWFQQQRHLEEFGDNAPITGLDIRLESSKEIDGGKVGRKYDIVSYSAEELEQFLFQVESLTIDFRELKDRTTAIRDNKN